MTISRRLASLLPYASLGAVLVAWLQLTPWEAVAVVAAVGLAHIIHTMIEEEVL